MPTHTDNTFYIKKKKSTTRIGEMAQWLRELAVHVCVYRRDAAGSHIDVVAYDVTISVTTPPSRPPQSNSLDRKPLKRSLKTCDKDAGV